jgi:energy-coupling factor transporter transmembrane protein EcfT
MQVSKAFVEIESLLWIIGSPIPPIECNSELSYSCSINFLMKKWDGFFRMMIISLLFALGFISIRFGRRRESPFLTVGIPIWCILMIWMFMSENITLVMFEVMKEGIHNALFSRVKKSSDVAWRAMMGCVCPFLYFDPLDEWPVNPCDINDFLNGGYISIVIFICIFACSRISTDQALNTFHILSFGVASFISLQGTSVLDAISCQIIN